MRKDMITKKIEALGALMGIVGKRALSATGSVVSRASNVLTRINGVRSLCIAFALHFGLSATAAEPVIMILSSDASVNKYSIAQDTFKETINRVTIDVDLGAESATEPIVENIILDNNPDLLYCIGSKAYFVAKKYAGDKNLVVTSAINWERFKLTQKTFGVANELPTGMQLTFFRYFFPEIKKIGVLYSKKYNKEWLEQTIADGKDVDIEIIGRSVARTKDIKRALTKLLPKVDAVWLTSDPIVLAEKDSIQMIFSKSDELKIPVFAYDTAFASYGAVLMIAADIPTIGQQAGNLAQELLDNSKIDEKFQSPVGSSITLNMKKIVEYGIKLNKDALDSVNEIIE